jgi:hypothetical protein
MMSVTVREEHQNYYLERRYVLEKTEDIAQVRNYLCSTMNVLKDSNPVQVDGVP